MIANKKKATTTKSNLSTNLVVPHILNGIVHLLEERSKAVADTDIVYYIAAACSHEDHIVSMC